MHDQDVCKITAKRSAERVLWLHVTHSFVYIRLWHWMPGFRRQCCGT